jgi:hypothetical protein
MAEAAFSESARLLHTLGLEKRVFEDSDLAFSPPERFGKSREQAGRVLALWKGLTPRLAI